MSAPMPTADLHADVRALVELTDQVLDAKDRGDTDALAEPGERWRAAFAGLAQAWEQTARSLAEQFAPGFAALAEWLHVHPEFRGLRWMRADDVRPWACPCCGRTAERVFELRGYGPRTELRCPASCWVRWRPGVRAPRD